MNVVFVILHYQNIDDTLNCVESICSLKTKDNIHYKMIIVDNKSPNESGLTLKNKFEDREDIEVILLDKNYGFSKANNIGYKRAKELSPDAILVINNDILFEDDCFLEKLYEFYQSSPKCDILCPDIINLQKNHQNPLRRDFITKKKAYKNMIYKYIISVLLAIPFVRKIVFNFENKRLEKWFCHYYENFSEIKIENGQNFVPFGAFVIYMGEWLKHEDIAFPSDTFMYAEEDFLSVYVKSKNYKIAYYPKLKVKHLEGRSVEVSNVDVVRKLRFKYYHEALALRKYLRFYKKQERGKKL